MVVDGLPLFQGAQVAVDTTLVCPLTRTGEAKPRTMNEPESGTAPEGTALS